MEDGTEEQYMQEGEGEEYDENYVELQEGNEGEGENGENEENDGQQNGEQGYSNDLQGRVQAILDRTGYPHQITTGQRKFGPPPNYDGPAPGSGHEVYVGKLPNDAYEDELIPLFETFGTIYDMRIMMDPGTGKTKGFGFVTFMEKESAQQAARACDGKCLRTHGKPMKANVSIPNNRLFVGNIPKSKSQEDIKNEFSRTIEGIEEVIVYAHPDDSTKKNRGFCFLDFESHGAASTARKKIMSGRFTFFKMAVICDWADPQDEPDQETMSKVKVLYIRNLKADVTEEKLDELFQQYGALEKVKRVKDYGFVHFQERTDALRALEELNNTMIESSQMLITLAKPPIDSKIKEKRKKYRLRLCVDPTALRSWIVH